MSNKKQSSIDWLIKEFSEILGPVKTTAMQNLFLVDAVQKAKAMHKEETENTYNAGWKDGRHWPQKHSFESPRHYYEETFES